MKESPLVLVSIVCNTYNQKKYIINALESFVMQKTDFQFEILVHDDASTDGTDQVIREFAINYPDIVIPILEDENQYSKGVRITEMIINNFAKGKYIAFCEGDDYWIDPLKLQKQIDYLERNSECMLCFTNAYCEINGNREKKVMPWTPDAIIKESGIYNVGEIEVADFIPTVSFVFRKSAFQNLPKIDSRAFSGDNYWKLGLTLQGYAYGFSDCTCVYRFGVENSYTTKSKANKEFLKNSAMRFILLLEEFDKITNGEYHKQFEKKIVHWTIIKCDAIDNYAELKNYKNYFYQQKPKEVVKFWLMAYFPNIYKFMRKLK